MTATVRAMPDIVGDERGMRSWRAVRLASMLTEQERKERIAYVIRTTLARRGMKAPELGRRVGRGRGTILDWAAGRSTPSLVDLGPLCIALGLDPTVFAELPPIPADPLASYLREIAPEAAAAGIARGRTRARRAPGTPARPRVLRPGDSEPGPE